MVMNDMFRSLFPRNTRRNRAASATTPRLTEKLEARQLLTLVGMNVDVSQSFDSSTVTSNATASGVVVAEGATETELTSFANTFDIDIDASTIAMNFNYTGAAASDPSGVVPAGTVHQYTFEFGTVSNETITASANSSASLIPTVSVRNGNTVVVEITEGMRLGSGFDALIDVQVNRNSSSITGRKFQDINRNGSYDSNEPWLSGWQVQLLDFEQQSNVIDTVTTDTDGRYEFQNVPGGTYLVREVLQEGWEQTSPTTPDDVAAFDFDREFELREANSDFLNWGGRQERWIFGSGSWYFITPDGAFYRWNGSPSSNLTGELLHTFDPAFYSDPTKLTNAPSPRRYVVDVDGATPETFRNRDFGNHLTAPEFAIINNGDNTATFNWAQLSGHTYDVWISNLGTRTRVPVPADLTGGTYTTDALPDGRYRVWLQSKNASGVLSAWTRGFDFEFTRDALTTPIHDGLDAGIDRTPTLDITPVTDATSYDVQVSNAQGRIVYQGTGNASHRVSKELPLGTYSVSVRANFDDGSRNAFSAPQTLTIDGRPAVNFFRGTLAWSPVKAATEYDVWIDRLDEDGNRVDIQVVRTQNLRDTFLVPNLPRGGYAVWVRAIRSEGGERHASFWSHRLNFRIVESSQDSVDEPLLADEQLVAFRDESQADPGDQENESPRRTQTAENSDVERHVSTNKESVVAVMMEIATSGIMPG